MRKFLALFLAAVLAFGLLPCSALAEEDAGEVSLEPETISDENASESPEEPSAEEDGAASMPSEGVCGDDVRWSLSEDGVLTVSGTGDMDNYAAESLPPYSGSDAVRSLVIRSGVTSLGDFAFYACPELTTVTIPASVTSVGESAFDGCEKLETVRYLGTAEEWGSIVVGDKNAPLTDLTPDIHGDAHVWEEQTTEPTCTEDGCIVKTCTVCGTVTVEAIPASGHSEVIDEAVAPTCTEAGRTEGSHCGICGAVCTPQEEIPALGHTPERGEADPVEYWYCTLCGKTFADEACTEGISLTVSALASENTYAITYELNGGTNDPDNPTACAPGESITLRYPTREGYFFGGWYLDADFTVPGASAVVNSDLTFYARWNPATYTLVYNANGGTGTMRGASGVPCDEVFTLRRCAFTKKGYTFTGWNTAKDGSGSGYGDEQSVSMLTTENGTTVTLYAQWELTDYALTYELHGASVPNPNPVSYTMLSDRFTLSPLPDDPELGAFLGWYKDASFKTKAGAVSKGSTGNRTFYAKWSNASYTITYVTGGEVINPNPDTYRTSDPNLTLAAPTAADSRMGTFLGWYTGTSYKTKVTSVKTGSAGDRVLYARWKSDSYKITYVLNGGTNAKANPKTYRYSDPLTELLSPTRKGYTFLGWYDNAELTGEPVTSFGGGEEGNRKLYASWEMNTYSIRYVLRGGTAPVNAATGEAVNPSTYTVKSSTIKLAKPTRTGYTFLGWYKDPSLKTKVTSLAKGSTGDVVLYAKWSVNSYTIRFSGNGSTGGSMKNQTLKYNASAVLGANRFTRTGFVFAGWNTAKDGSGAFYADGASVMDLVSNGTVTLYAQWTPIVYLITYELNGGTVSGENPAVYDITQTPLTIIKPTRTGYTFAGWYKDAKYKTKFSNRSGLHEDLTLYAKWTPVTYTFTFKGNGSTGGSMSKQTVRYIGNESAVLKTNAFTRTNYAFAGWNTAKDGSGTAYADETPVSVFASGTQTSYTLYAQWKPVGESDDNGTTISYVTQNTDTQSGNTYSLTVTCPSGITAGKEAVFYLRAESTDSSSVLKYLLCGVSRWDGSEWVSVYSADPADESSDYTADPVCSFTFATPGTYAVQFAVKDTAFSYRFVSGYTSGTWAPGCLLDVADAESGGTTAEQEAASVAARCEAAVGASADDYTKALWLNDWMVTNVTPDDTYTYSSAEGPLLKGTGTCEAYHRAYAMLLDAVGIENARVEGYHHVWTAAKLDGSWYQIDTFCDDSGDERYYDDSIDLYHLYFGLTDEIISLVPDGSEPSENTGADIDVAANEEVIWNTLYAYLGNAYGTAALMGNLYAESGLIPNNLQNNGNSDLNMTDAAFTAAYDSGAYDVETFIHDEYGYGLAQWTAPGRKQALANWAKKAGTSIGDLGMQLSFLCEELKSFSTVLSALRSAESVREASDVVLTKFECPYDQSNAVKIKRASYGQTYFSRYAEDVIPPTAAHTHAPVSGCESTALADNYFLRSGAIEDFSDEYVSAIRSAIAAGSTSLSLPIAGSAVAWPTGYKNIIFTLAAYQLSHYESFSASVTVTYSSNVLSVTIG